MNTDFLIAVGAIVLAALVLHWKSHVKFIAIGGFIGLVLAETVSLPLQTFLAKRWEFFGSDMAISVIQISLLMIPAVLLGLNHSVDKRRLGLGRTIITVVITTLFVFTNVLAFLPIEWQQRVVDSSVVGLQLQELRGWIIVGMAALIIVDSFHHNRVLKANKNKR